MNIKQRLKRGLKALLLRLPGGTALLQRLRTARFRRAWGGLRTPREIFGHFYETNRWRDAESVSGPGSTLAYTANLRAELPGLFARLGVRRVLDAPCGDYNWFRQVERPCIDYVGGDIVGAMVQANQARYGDAQTRFVELDITVDPLPSADLWLCRDVLFHLSEEDVFKALANFVSSDIKYLLTSTHPRCTQNRDIASGDFRLLNLRLAPYGFAAPLAAIDDWVEGYPERQISLWERDAVAGFLRA